MGRRKRNEVSDRECVAYFLGVYHTIHSLEDDFYDDDLIKRAMKILDEK